MRVLIKSIIAVLLIQSICADNYTYYTPCNEDGARDCVSSTNRSQFLLSLKKGGTNVLSTQPYLSDFFLCEQYNYDCGYMPHSDSYVTVANGVSLDMSVTQLTDITTQASTQSLIQPYLGHYGDSAKCGMLMFPLILTPAQSTQVLDGYINKLVTNLTNAYNADRISNSTTAWANININIRTAILSKFKSNRTMIRNSTMYSKLVTNDYHEISDQLKQYYKENDEQIDLHAAYLIDSVTTKCNKLQSVNFLVDQSGSIGTAGFQLALQFLQMYVNNTNDDLTKASIHFFDDAFDPYIYYNNNLAYFQTKIPIKPYRHGGTYTGLSMNKTIDLIVAANFPNGLPKIMVIMTDGGSYDSVVEAANKAAANGIFIIAVGIGANVNDAQLLQIAGTSSNLIKISNYADLPKLVQFIENYFCKQIYTIELNQTYYDNFVRVPSSPSYFRVVKSPATQGEWYELDITYASDPTTHDHCQYQSQIDPFADQFTEYNNAEHYKIFTQPTSGILAQQHRLSGAFVPKIVYFIEPTHPINFTVKKNIMQEMNATVSYVSVGGTNLGFNISLIKCTTLTCVEEKAKYNSFKPAIKNTTNTVVIIPPTQDLSIFIVIGSTLAVLACLCALFIFALRRYGQEEKKKNKLKIHDFERTITQQNMDDTLMPADSHKKIQKEKANITVQQVDNL